MHRTIIHKQLHLRIAVPVQSVAYSMHEDSLETGAMTATASATTLTLQDLQDRRRQLTSSCNASFAVTFAACRVQCNFVPEGLLCTVYGRFERNIDKACFVFAHHLGAPVYSRSKFWAHALV